jgi:serine/threonine protein kinase
MSELFSKTDAVTGEAGTTVAERSTAAVGVAETSGEREPLTTRMDEANADSATDGHSDGGSQSPAGTREPRENGTRTIDSGDGSGDSGPSREARRPSVGHEGAERDESLEPSQQDTAPFDPIFEPVADDTAPFDPISADGPVGAEPVGTPQADAAAKQPGSETGRDPQAAEAAQAARTPEPEKPAKPSKTGKPAKNSERGRAAESPRNLTARELHSGHKLARRYRLEECVTRLDGFSSWRAVDEKLRRAVGVHILPSGHSHARHVLSAARSSALLGDPRFVQVLDAVEDHELVYVVHEWLPDAVPLSTLLASGPLPAHDAYQLVTQLSQALTAAHREGLAHLRLTPGTVLRTGSGQYRIRGLAVNAALRGITSNTPQRDDTEAIGALLYAALTQRWPYEEDAYGLTGVGTLAKGTLVAPDQVRAGVHRGLSQLAMRALMNDGATASSQEQPCTTPEELAKAVATLPRIRPPETSFSSPPPYQRTTYQQGAYGPGAPSGRPAPGPHPRPAQGGEPPAPPALPGRTGKALKWGVSALLIAALGLGSWQLADTLLKGDATGTEAGQANAHGTSQGSGKPLKIVKVKDFDPPPGGNGSENSGVAPDAVDGNPASYWFTQKYYGRPDLGNLKPGVGLILDLGKPRDVHGVKVDFMGRTSADFMAAPRSASGMPTSLDGFHKISSGTGEHLTLQAKKPVTTRYVLVWLTKLPLSGGSDYRGRVTEIKVLG